MALSVDVEREAECVDMAAMLPLFTRLWGERERGREGGREGGTERVERKEAIDGEVEMSEGEIKG